MAFPRDFLSSIGRVANNPAFYIEVFKALRVTNFAVSRVA
jgi:hypothetical protein